jgi:hypothetical protein
LPSFTAHAFSRRTPEFLFGGRLLLVHELAALSRLVQVFLAIVFVTS